jgi:PadR family transcriptional regulator PadR
MGRLWVVRARVERYVEPALLLLLSERPMHGYEILDEVKGLAAEGAALDLGNLYRVLRALEAEGLVSSQWQSDIPGPAKRVYELTAEGRDVLRAWAEALERTRGELDGFLRRYATIEGR